MKQKRLLFKRFLSLFALLSITMGAKAQDMTATPLTLEALETETTVVFRNEATQPVTYQVNGGETQSIDGEDEKEINLNEGDKVCFFGDNSTYSRVNGSMRYRSNINCNKVCYVYGNIMSLVNSTDFATAITLTGEEAFAHLFKNAKIRNHTSKALVLPATTLSNYCYYYMFWGCENLTKAPELPAMTMAENCYEGMFYKCTGLTTTPNLPATTLANYCYQSMFEDCSSLVTVPAQLLHVTNLKTSCYRLMFKNCTSLITAPKLPATTMAKSCYESMFKNSGLTTAPDLPATTLESSCYRWMFDGCKNLTSVTCLATNISASNCTEQWLNNVAATGTFTKATDMTEWTSDSENGIPSGWTVKTASSVTANSDEKSTPGYWVTYYNNSTSVVADANTTVFTAKVNGDKTKVILTEVTDKIVPAGNAVILKSTATPIIMTIVSASGTLDNNDLQGSSDDIATPPNTYMLSKNASNVVGFYQWSGTNIPAGKAYLTLPSSARSFLGFGDGQTTTINAVKKVIADEPIYNLTGRKVGGNPQRGIYIRNGKKFIIK